MKVQKSIDVWLVQKRTPRQIDLVQYDTGVQLVFTVQDFTIPSGTTATLYVQKPSGKFVYQETGITVNGNTITVDLNNQAITEHGNSVGYQVQLKNGNDTVTTFAGIFRVEKSLKDAGATESKTVLAAFEAKTAEQIAEIEAVAQDQIAQIQSLYTTYATKNEAANAIKGNLSGAVVFADDVSPIEHNPIVKVHGKNLFNYDAWKGVNAIHGEVTYSDDGVVKLTATEDDCFTNYGMFPEAARIPVKPGETVTLSWETDADETLTSGLNYIFMNGTADLFQSAPATQKKVTFTAPIGCEFVTFRLGVSTTGDSITYWNIQIEKGDVATDYEPYIDPTSVMVKRYGKNLLPSLKPGYSETLNGATFTVIANGGIKASGTATAISYIVPYSGVPLVKNAPMTVSLTGTHSNILLQLLFFDDVNATGENNIASFNIYDSLTVDMANYPSVVKMELFYKRIDNAAVGGTGYIQVEAGEKVTDFEVYKTATTHTPSADGTVPGITSLSPNMTILTDTEGVIVECEYIRDTNKVIDKLTNAIIALGGTV